MPRKHEPQELTTDEVEESKAPALQVVRKPDHWNSREASGSPAIAMEDKQPQSLIL